MNTVTLRFPKNRLAALSRQAGGKARARAVSDAQAGLLALAGPCREALDRALVAIGAHWAAFLAAPSKDTADALYDAVNAIIGVASTIGLPELDRAAYSLCDLLDHMQESGRWDLPALEVQVRALQSRSTPTAPQDQAQRALLDLNQACDRLIASTDEPRPVPLNSAHPLFHGDRHD